MTDEIDWFRIEIWQLEKMVNGSSFEVFVDDSGETIDTSLHLCNHAESSPTLEVAITDRDDLVLLEDFKEHPFDRNYVVLNLPGLWNFAYEKVYGHEPE